jgi:hypothetical protein
MVHALAECRRVLRTAGLLIDLRPFAGNWPLEVVAPSASPTRSTPGAWAVGRVDDSQERPDDQAANAAIAHAVRAGWFRAERTTTFEYAWYWDTLAELEAYIAERWATVLRLPPPDADGGETAVGPDRGRGAATPAARHDPGALPAGRLAAYSGFLWPRSGQGTPAQVVSQPAGAGWL